MLTVAQASARVRAAIAPLAAELVPLDDAWQRHLAADIVADRQLPPWDNSAMDGFAVRAADLPGTLAGTPPITLPVVGTIAAGHAPDVTLEPGTTWRIMTGAPMPAGADAVVIREDVDDQGERARFADPARPGQNVRPAGQDIATGATVLRAGTCLDAGAIGLLAALGHAAVRVRRRPRVAILSTGDELVSVGLEPRPGQIINSNAHALAAQVREAGGVPVHAGIGPDEPRRLTAMIRTGLDADVLVTSGGVSVGDFDHVRDAYAQAGVSVDFWKVAMKPGKPLAFGVAPGGTPVFGLPGNPVSSMMVFELFVRPALLAMQGASALDRPRVEVVLAAPYRKQPGRTHYPRARLRRDGDTLVAELHGKQGSGMLSSMLAVDALVEIDRDLGDVDAGTRLPALLVRAV